MNAARHRLIECIEVALQAMQRQILPAGSMQLPSRKNANLSGNSNSVSFVPNFLVLNALA
jgi:hypothetical protein